MADESLQSPSDAKTPDKNLRRWLLEIKLARKREEPWRKKSKSVLETYRGINRKKNSFNILWANTEVLRPALYNSQPKPDVRRRFRQKDPLGKAVAEVAERSLSYCVDAYDLDSCLKNDVLDALLPGRAVTRVRYIPTIKQVQGTAVATTEPQVIERDEKDPQEAFEGMHEEVEYEQALCDHVQWDDFIHGPGKSWAEVTWVGFLCRFTKDDLVEKFGKEVADKVKLGEVEDTDVSGQTNHDIKEVFQRAELWEIWDKDSEKVFFITESYRTSVIYPEGQKGEPPLKFKNFFPCPQPLQMVEDTGTTIPTPLYEEYREQAEELDRLSARINKIIAQCKVRFVYDPSLSELKALMDATDGEGIPAEQARAWMANGGIEKAIWWMPIETLAMVLKELYVARDSAKQVVYEITGISDILRGATNPNETLGAQQLKANSSSMRLQRMQREVQRYVRDLIRLLAEVIGEHFSYQTLQKMTGLNFPTNEQKQQIQLQIQAGQQQLQQQAQATGQPPQIPPQIQQKLQMAQQALAMPSWEDIMAVLQSDMQREYRVDIETDSTVAESITKDMEGLKEALSGVIELWNGAGPAVQAGAVSMDAIKALTMSIVRHARMGLEVEDALESGMQEPKPQADPNAAKLQQDALKQQHDAALAQNQAAHDQAMEQVNAQREQANQQAEQQRQGLVELAKHQREQDAIASKAALEQQKQAFEGRIAALQDSTEDAFNRWKVERDNAAKIKVAEISAKAVMSKEQAQAAENDGVFQPPEDPQSPVESDMSKLTRMHAELLGTHQAATAQHAATLGHLAQMHQDLIDTLKKPKRSSVVRPDGSRYDITTIQ